MNQPALIIHGGAGAREGQHTTFQRYLTSLTAVRESAWQMLVDDSARAAVLAAIRAMEDDPVFNAGRGSRLQRDGAVRMSAALMDEATSQFAGVINIERTRHPIDVADALHGARHPVLAGSKATDYARSLEMPEFDPVTPHRLEEHWQHKAGKTGTVGAAAVDAQGRLWVGTSTGGVGYERPGRVSDSATVAGTCAGAGIGVSCTGIGEHIVNHAAAARIVTRAADGMEMAAAIERTIDEAETRSYEYGLIAVDLAGRTVAGRTRDVVTLFASRDAAGDADFLGPPG